MAGFTGMIVQVTLKQPPNTILKGKVTEVVAGQTLTLQHVYFPHNNQHWPEFTVPGTAIADLQVIDANPAPTPVSAIRTTAPQFPPPPNIQLQQRPNVPQVPPQHPAPPSLPQQQPQRQPSNFVDPAILSYGRSPVQTRGPALPPVEAPATPVKSMMAKAAESLPVNVNSSPFVAEPNGTRKVSKAEPSPQASRTTRQQTPLAAKDLVEDGQEQGQGEIVNKKKIRRGQKKKGTPGAAPASSDPPPVMNIEVSRNGNDMNGTVKRGKGWRNTPLLQPSPQTGSGADANGSASKPQTRKQREREAEEQKNGWATEDATDVQDMGDFDFEANNKLFDKKGVFETLRQGDTTADEDRLVSHNKIARPGTYGGKNLHPTENVLSPHLPPKYGSNEADSTSDADTELNLANGRSSSRHSATRSAIGKKVPSRQNSSQVDGKPHPLVTSMSSDRGGLARSVTSIASRNKSTVPALSAISPQPERTHSPQSAVSFTKQPRSLSSTLVQEPHFVIQQTLSTCPCLLPSALDTLESETVSRFGLTQDAITETAARSVAEVAMRLFEPYGGSRRGSRANTIRGSMSSSMVLDRSQPPVIVIMAGNNAVGARAVAAARHLISRKMQVIIAEATFESKETQDLQMRTQVAMIKRLHRAGATIKRGAWRKAYNYIKGLTGPPAVIIDALLAGSTYDSLLVSNAQHAATTQQEAREMIDWANRSRAPVLSVGCPSGVSGSDGSATVVEGEPLAVRPDKVLALGAPMQGLLEAAKNGERWDTSVADVGLNITLRSEEAVAFGAQWIAEVKFAEDEATAEAV